MTQHFPDAKYSNRNLQGLAGRLTEYGDRDFSLFLRRSFIKSLGLSNAALNKPIIGILNTYSELNSCHRGFPELVQAVKRGVWQAGGLPLEFPTISLGEPYLHPTSMMMRNLMSMDVEVMLRSQPLDAVVLVGGCDKTLPALLMGAASAELPSILLAAGPMLTGSYEGKRVGACTDCRREWARFRRGEIDHETVTEFENELVPTTGTCGVMGTASTMACLAEAMGMMLPGGASIPAVYAERLRHAEATGKQAVVLAGSGLTPGKIMTTASIENAVRTLLAIGGSTNAVIHLAAIAGRLGIQLKMEMINELGRNTPLLVAVKPAGEYYMEDFYRAGGMTVVLQELKPMLQLNAITVTGKTLGDVLSSRCKRPAWQSVIRSADNPLQKDGALVVLHGNLAPDGAVLKRSAATQELLEVTGRAVVFSSVEDLMARIDEPDLDVRPEDILVLHNAGLIGGPGMPEVGSFPIPKKLGNLKDIVRISDGRMSGTAFGTIVLHVSPEAAVGGPLRLVRQGDLIELSVTKRELNLLVDQKTLDARRLQSQNFQTPSRGYERLYFESIQQCHLGADFDFLRHESLQPP